MLTAWHLWIIVGLVLWILEIFTSGFVIGVFGTACFIAAPFAAAGVSFKIQLLVFGLATAALSLGIRPLVMRHIYRRDTRVDTNVDALVGQTGVVIEAIDQAAGTGRVKIGGEDWRAVVGDGSLLAAGTRVIVRSIDGCKVVVERVDGF